MAPWCPQVGLGGEGEGCDLGMLRLDPKSGQTRRSMLEVMSAEGMGSVEVNISW